MKICIFNNEPIETAGGAGTASFSIAKELSKNGQDIYYIIRSLNDDNTVTRDGNLTIIRICDSRHGKLPIIPLIVHRYCVHFFKDLNKIRKILKKIQPDVFLSFNTVAAFYVMINNFGRKDKFPFIISFRHDPLLRKMFLMPKATKKLWKYHPIITSAHSFTSPSNSLAKNVEPYINRTIDVIPNGIDTSLYYPCSLQNHDKLSRPIILCLSRLAPEKRVEDAIQAMPILLKRHPNIILRVVGDGKERESLIKLVDELNISESVEFLGHIPHNQVISQYHSATLFLLTSNDEGFPNTFLEAIACGLPVVTTPVGDLKEIVTDAHNGIVVNFQSPDEIADAISLICSNYDTYNNLSNLSLELSREYSWEEVGKVYHEYFRKIVDKCPKASQKQNQETT